MKPAFIPLAAGLQTELAAHLVTPGATLLCENFVNPKTGKCRVRYGSDVLSTDVQATVPNGSLSTPWQLATLEGALVRFNRAPNPVHLWAPSPQVYAAPSLTEGGILTYRKGPIKVDASPVFSGAVVDESVFKPTVAVSSRAIVVVYAAANAGPAFSSVVSLLDPATRKPLFTKRLASGAKTPRVVIVGTVAVVAYELGGNLHADAYSLTAFGLLQTVTVGTLTPGTAIDIRAGSIVAGATKVGILYRDSSNLMCATVDSTNLSTNQVDEVQFTGGTSVDPDLAFGWMQDLGVSGKKAVMSADTTNGLRVLWDVPAPTAGVAVAVRTDVIDAAATAAPSGSTPGIRNVTGSTVTSSTSGVYRVFYEVTAPSFPTRAKVKHKTWDGSAHTDTAIASVGIRSKLWTHASDLYFLAAFDGQDQRSYFVLSATMAATTGTTYPAPQAVAMVRDAGGLTEAENSPTDVAVDASGAIHLAVTSETRVESTETAGVAAGDTARLLAIETVRLRHAAAAETEVGRPAEFTRSLFTPGGLLGQFDGETYAAAGFPYYPPFMSAATGGAGGNLDHEATYLGCAVASFIDRNGRKWRSAPSTPISYTTTATDWKVDWTVETLRLVDRGLPGAVVGAGFQIEFYRTQANATEGFFLVATMSNDPTQDTITLTDNVADDDLGEQLYTDGGGVENQLLPPVSNAVEYQGRLVCAESGAGTLWYSVEADFTNGLIFSEALTLDVGDPSEAITGLAVYAETLFVFKAGKIYVVSGQGANALGQGATYFVRLIDPSVGTVNPQSIAVAGDGVWFRSGSDRAGIYQTSGGKAEYVGQGVREYDGLTITAAAVVKDKTEIRFYTAEGRTLVWYVTTQSWGTNTSQPCLTATTGYSGADGVVYARSSDNYVLSESSTIYAEGATAYTGKARSPWYQAGGLAGWGRVKRFQGVGEGGSANTTTVRLYKDMATSPFQTAVFEFDGTDKRWLWEIRPAQQKASMMMVEVEISPPDGGSMTAGPDIVGVSLIPVAKEGMDKLPASRRGT